MLNREPLLISTELLFQRDVLTEREIPEAQSRSGR